MNQDLLKICKLALEHLKHSIHKDQKRLLLKQMFAKDACIDPIFYEPGEPQHHDRVWGDLESNYEEKLLFATKLNTFIRTVQDEQFNQAMDAFFKERFNSKQTKDDLPY